MDGQKAIRRARGTAFAGLLLLLAGAAGAACPKPAANAVWVWHYREALLHPRAVVERLAHKHIGRVYLQLARPMTAYDPFLRAAHREGIEVYALDGEPSYTLDRGPLLRRIALMRGHAFDGVQVDVEPYALPGFRADTANYIRRYLHLLTVARRETPRALPLSVVIPTWFAHTRWREGSVAGAVLRRADQIVVMSYRGGLAAARRRALPVLLEAARAHKPAYIGVKPWQAAEGLPPARPLSAGYVIERYKYLADWPETALVKGRGAPRSCSSEPLG